MKTLLLKKDEVRRLIGMTEVIGAVEEAMIRTRFDGKIMPGPRRHARQRRSERRTRLLPSG
ncbi:hypothetical protein AJ87_49600 [Rhizobium yanglingense]|nr:hypothetical protein AJ87_49600 [Rhizobium yanglingense]